MTDGSQQGAANADSEVWQAISAFEKILEVMPNDRSSLETLSHAYEHVGDRARALDYLLRLAEVVVAEKDAETAPHITERLAEYSEADEQVRDLLSQLQLLQAGEQQQTDSAAATSAETQARPMATPRPFRVTDELGFAWKLLEAGEISQDDYAALAQDLAELSTDPDKTTVSVLHVLETKAFSGMERVMGYVSRDTKTPLVSVQAYDVAPEMAEWLPIDFMIRHGVVVFGKILDELLVAIMNPYNMRLREDIAVRTGRACHFFMTPPGEFDTLITLLKASM